MRDEELPVVNRNMKRLRVKCGLTQKQMGDIIHLDHRTISEYENGHFEPSVSIIIQYCDYFHVSADELLGYSANNRLETAIVPSEEELQLIDGYRRRRKFQQDAIKMLCLDGAKLLNEQKEIEEEREWIEKRLQKFEKAAERKKSK